MNSPHYKSEYGYYIKNVDNNAWVFIPFEREFDSSILTNIIHTLKYLNEYKPK